MFIATSHTRLRPASGQEYRDRRFSRARGNPDTQCLPWPYLPTSRALCRVASAPARRLVGDNNSRMIENFFKFRGGFSAAVLGEIRLAAHIDRIQRPEEPTYSAEWHA